MLIIKGDTVKLIKGVSFSWLRFALTIGIGLIQAPILFKYVDNKDLNFWYIFYSFGAFLQMADLGLIQTISRLIAYRDNTYENNEQLVSNAANFKNKQIYYTSLFSFFCIISLIGIVIYYTFFYVHGTSGKVDSYELRLSFILYLLGVVFTLISNIPGAMLIGYRDIAPESIIRSGSQLLYFIILILGLPYYKSIVFVSCAFFIQNITQFSLLHIVFRLRHINVFKEYVPVYELIKIRLSKNIYRQSLPLVINQLGGWLINQGSIFVASIIIGPERISDYAINQQVFTYTASIALVVNQALGPFIAKQYVQNKADTLKQLFVSAVILCLTIVSLLIVVQIVCGKEIISLWVGSSHYLGLTFSVLMGLITFLEVHHSVGGNFVWNTGSWPFNTWTLLAGILNVSLGYILCKQFGITGMAFATFVAKLCTLNWYVIYYYLKRSDISIKYYMVKVFIPVTLILLGAFSVSGYMKYVLENTSFTTIQIIILITIVSSTSIGLSTLALFKKQFIEMYGQLVPKSNRTSKGATVIE